jgi:hypothetical protein
MVNSCTTKVQRKVFLGVPSVSQIYIHQVTNLIEVAAPT